MIRHYTLTKLHVAPGQRVHSQGQKLQFVLW